MDQAAFISAVRALFPVAEEFELARAIYSFEAAHEDGLTPQQAYDDFDAWTRLDPCPYPGHSHFGG